MRTIRASSDLKNYEDLNASNIESATMHRKAPSYIRLSRNKDELLQVSSGANSLLYKTFDHI